MCVCVGWALDLLELGFQAAVSYPVRIKPLAYIMRRYTVYHGGEVVAEFTSARSWEDKSTHTLFLQRPGVQFLAPTLGDSKKPTNPAAGL